ncbi:MAG: OmpA family protein [Gemmatimonadota bacterium]
MVTRAGLPVAVVALAAGAAGCTHLVHREDLEGRFEPIEATQADHETRITALESDVAGIKDDLAALRRELEQLREDFNGHVSDEEMHGGMRVSLPVHFDFDRAEIRDVDRPILDHFAAAVTRHAPNALVTVEGFADSSGSEAYNMRLSRQRAEAVKSYLVEPGGLSAERVRTAAFGELRSRQVIPDAKGPGQSGIENRRVSFVIEWAGAPGEAPPGQ